MDIQGGALGCPWTNRGVIWDVQGSSMVSMDIQGGHLRCPWTSRGSFGVSMDIYKGSSGVSMDIQGGELGHPWTYRGVILGVHGHTGGHNM